MIAALLIISALACALWLLARPQSMHCELFELSDKGGAEGMSIVKRKRPVHLLRELPLFLCWRLPNTLWRKGRQRFSSGLACCYKVPHYSDVLGGKIPVWLHVGDTAQLLLSFPWQKPYQDEGDDCGTVSNFIYCNEASCPSLEVELEAPGMRVIGQQAQRHELSRLPAVYRWELSADKPGRFVIRMTATLHADAEDMPLRAVAAHHVRVIQLPFLTGRQVRRTAAALAVLAAALTLAVR
jgi:hypothetical protein